MPQGQNLVKCKDCGWLGVRQKASRILVDADDAYRNEGTIPRLKAGSSLPEPVIESLPICYAGRRKFYDEMQTPTPNEAIVKAALAKPYPCDSITPWQSGLSPKELEQMKMLEEQRAALAREADRQRIWQAGESKKADDRHTENLKAVVKAGWSNVWSALAAAALGGIVGAWAAGKQIINVQPAPVVTPSQPTPPDVGH